MDYIKQHIDSLDNINTLKYGEESINALSGRIFDYDNDIYLED